MNTFNKPKYEELSYANIANSKDIVVSKSSRGGYSIAQRIKHVDKDTGEKIVMFCKGTIIVKDKEGLERMRDALTVAISKQADVVEENIQENEEWDDV